MSKKDASVDISIAIPEDVTREAARFMQRVIGPFADFGDFCSDNIRFYRWKSAVRTIELARKYAEERGILANQVPVKFLVPFLERCSLEEDGSEITEEWAKLLASVAKAFDDKHLVYADILSRIGPREARIIRRYWGQVDKEFFRTRASAFQVYGHDYALQTITRKLESLYGGPTLDAVGGSEAKKRGCFTVMSIGGPKLSSDDTGLGIMAKNRIFFSDTKYWQIGKTPEQDREYNSVMSSLAILERERLIMLKSYSEEYDDNFLSLMWAELTPFGFDFVETLEGA